MTPVTTRQLEDRLGAALYRLSTLERRAAAAQDSPKVAARLVDDVSKLAGELERTFADVRQVMAECARLQEAATAAEHRARMLFEAVPSACLVLDATGAITDANGPAVQLLNVSRRHLLGRPFQLYLGGEREAFLGRLRGLATDGEPGESWRATLRPRERSRIEVVVSILSQGDERVLVVVQPARVSAAVAPAPGLPDRAVSAPSSA